MPDKNPTRRVADELEIRNLVAKLAQVADEGDLAEYLALFTEDAEWDGGAALGSTKGHAEILAAAEGRRSSGRAGPGSFTRHVVTTSTVDVQGDRASGRAVFHYYTKTDEIPALMMLGTYDDEFVRSEDGWRMARRKVSAGKAP